MTAATDEKTIGDAKPGDIIYSAVTGRPAKLLMWDRDWIKVSPLANEETGWYPAGRFKATNEPYSA